MAKGTETSCGDGSFRKNNQDIDERMLQLETLKLLADGKAHSEKELMKSLGLPGPMPIKIYP